MSKNTFDIQRRTDGSIDTDFYANRAIAMHKYTSRAVLRRLVRLIIRQTKRAFRQLAIRRTPAYPKTAASEPSM